MSYATSKGIPPPASAPVFIANGSLSAASSWSADRVASKIPEFTNLDTDGEEPIYFFGEMVRLTPGLISLLGDKRKAHEALQCFKAMYDDYAELRELKETANILAGIDHWPDLYDEIQLAKNEVPVYASVFVEDMYVNFDFAIQTARRIKNCKKFITNVLYHDSLTRKSDEVVKQLFALRDDVLD